MTTAAVPFTDEFQTLRIEKRIEIDAPIEVAFEAILEEMGPGSVMQDGRTMNLRVERWPGGRWFRDLGEGRGHLWGHIQVIKPPTLLEVCGPMFMSYPAVNFVQYRLTELSPGKRVALDLTHRAMGLIPQEHKDGVVEGWNHGLKMIRDLAMKRVSGQVSRG